MNKSSALLYSALLAMQALSASGTAEATQSPQRPAAARAAAGTTPTRAPGTRTTVVKPGANSGTSGNSVQSGGGSWSTSTNPLVNGVVVGNGQVTLPPFPDEKSANQAVRALNKAERKADRKAEREQKKEDRKNDKGVMAGEGCGPGTGVDC
jgi:hypothetical protein